MQRGSTSTRTSIDCSTSSMVVAVSTKNVWPVVFLCSCRRCRRTFGSFFVVLDLMIGVR